MARSLILTLSSAAFLALALFHSPVTVTADTTAANMPSNQVALEAADLERLQNYRSLLINMRCSEQKTQFGALCKIGIDLTEPSKVRETLNLIGGNKFCSAGYVAKNFQTIISQAVSLGNFLNRSMPAIGFKSIPATSDPTVREIVDMAKWIPLSYSCANTGCVQKLSGSSALNLGKFDIIDSGNEMLWFIVKLEKDQTLQLILRGTKANNMDDIAHDLEIHPTKFSQSDSFYKMLAPSCGASFQQSALNPNVFFHVGFMKRVRQYHDAIRKAVISASSKYPSHQWVINGYSLGASHAFIAAAALKPYFNNNLKAVYLIAMPRTGSEGFVNLLSNCIGGSKLIRAVNRNDMVSRIPAGYAPITTPGSKLVYFDGANVDNCVFGQGKNCEESSLNSMCSKWTMADHIALGPIRFFIKAN